MNLYGYAGGDPINNWDPLGLCPKSGGGDGKTDDTSDCPRGTSGWWAHRDAQGEGSSFVNNAMGMLAIFGADMRAQLPEGTLTGEFNLPIGPAAARSTANAIGRGHVFIKHVLERGEFAGLGIRTVAQFQGLVRKIMESSGTAVRQLSRGRTAYWDDVTGTIVIRDPRSADLGTAFRPVGGRSYFEGLP